MPDHLTPAQRSRAMKRVKLKDGSQEMLVQRELRARGLRFQRHVRSLPGSPDIVFPKEKVAVFVDGDFWHGWRLPAWEHKLTSFWRDKLRANRARDLRNFRRLRAQGWTVVRIWQHQLVSNLEGSVTRIVERLSHCPKQAAVKPRNEYESPALQAALLEGARSPHRLYGKATLGSVRKAAVSLK